ncbi:hypothetical protein F1559_001738 [Cyanidiococcus yangmingshanensis]|uniref:RRM domain-containing protein n=1 Tax=Cyanidiococcus yangmingshanensis TaxID=2690220 RepID=A0A7J7IDD0_9RHOD|nr:hypothetical protein F1559_001738 [Cyanidiococcus yangmingshanensis]
MPNVSRESRCKIFVGGLSWDTDEASLVAYFEKFGKLVDAVVMRNRNTGQPRGFGFVTFEDEEVARVVASMERHELDGRMVETKVAVPRSAEELESSKESEEVPTGRFSESNEANSRKLFVGGLPQACTEDDILAHFSQFGKIVEARIMVDHQTGQSRGYGFVIFADSSAAQKALAAAPDKHVVKGFLVHVKPAASRRGEAPGNKEIRSNPWGLVSPTDGETSLHGGYRGYGFDAFGVDYTVVAQYLHAIYGGDIESWESWAREARTVNQPPTIETS